LLNYSKSIKLVAHIELKFNIKKKDASWYLPIKWISFIFFSRFFPREFERHLFFVWFILMLTCILLGYLRYEDTTFWTFFFPLFFYNKPDLISDFLWWSFVIKQKIYIFNRIFSHKFPIFYKIAKKWKKKLPKIAIVPMAFFFKFLK
jgi:hypothetical protein